MRLPERVSIIDAGIRDGLQKESHLCSVEEKLELIEMMIDAGMKRVQIGSFVSPKAVPQMANSDELFRRLEGRNDAEFIAAPIPNMRGIERAISCGCKSVRVPVSASYTHNLTNFNCSPEETIAGFSGVITKAKENGVFVAGAIMMAFGSPWEYRIPIDDLKAIVRVYADMGVTEISLADTAGMGAPTQVYDMCVELRHEFPQIKNWILHLHNTRGLACGNILAAMEAGITSFETAFAGFGGCNFVPNATGNVSTEDVVHMMSEMRIETGLDLDKLLAVGRRAEEIMGHTGESYVLKAGKAWSLLKNVPG